MISLGTVAYLYVVAVFTEVLVVCSCKDKR